MRARAGEARKRAKELQAVRRHEERSKARARAAERKAESDDEVRGNLEPDMLPVFDSIRRSIKRTPRMSRTEAFLHWAHDNPGEVVAIQEIGAERDLQKMIREQMKLERKQVRSTRARAQAQAVPF